MAFINLQDPFQIGLLVTITLLVCLIGRIVGSHGKLVRQYKELQKQISELKCDIANLCAAAVNVDGQRNKIDFRLNNALERMVILEQCQGGPNTYQTAINEIKNGADSRYLVDACGFSEGEAELLVKVYGDGKGGADDPQVDEPWIGPAH